MTVVIYGYARVSTENQGIHGNSLSDQERQLKTSGCEMIYHDVFTGTKMDRPEFTKLLSQIQPGDRLVVTKLDRFARTASGGIETIRALLERGVAVHILNMGLIDNTPTGRLMVTMLLAFAEFERDMIVERTMAGKAVAKAKNPEWREGRKEIEIDADAFQKFREKQKSGSMTVLECCAELGISKATWYNRIRQCA